MRFIIINFAFHNEVDVGSRRWREMGAILACEHEVIAICGDAPGGTLEAPLTMDGIKVINVGTVRSPQVDAGGFRQATPNRWLKLKPIRLLKDLWFFPDTQRRWAERAVRLMGRLAHDSVATIVVTSSPTHSSHVAMLGWQARAAKPPFWVMDLRDPWTTSPDRYWPRKWPSFLHNYEVSVERKCQRTAGLVTVVGDRMARSVQTEFQSNPVIVFNGYWEKGRDPSPAPAAPTVPCAIRYCGKVIPELRSPDLLFEAARSLHLRPEEVRFEFWCNEPQLVLDCAAAHGVSSLVHCFKRVSREECSRLEETASANIILNGIVPDADYMVTAKVFDLITRNRPILAVTSQTSELRDVLEKCGSRLNAWDTPTARQALTSVVSNQASPPLDQDRAYSRERSVATFMNALKDRHAIR